MSRGFYDPKDKFRQYRSELFNLLSNFPRDDRNLWKWAKKMISTAMALKRACDAASVDAEFPQTQHFLRDKT